MSKRKLYISIQQVMQHLNKEVEGQLLRRPHVRMENWKLSWITTIQKQLYVLIKECDLQLYEGVASSPNSKSQTEEESFEN